MPRAAVGSVVERSGAHGVTFALRFRCDGRRHYLTLGAAADGWTRQRAEVELQNVQADVRRGLWHPPATDPEPAAPREVPTFDDAAREWLAALMVEGGRGGRGLSPAGAADLRWRLSHLRPTFGRTRVDAITVEDVDRFRRSKVAAGRLNATSINKILAALAGVLEQAAEYGHVARNVARGRRRRLAATTPTRTWIDRADHIAALLDGAGAVDRDARGLHGQRRAVVAVLALAGLRLGEMLDLRWSDVDLARGVLHVRGTKTAAAARTVEMLPALRDELLTYRATLRMVDPAARAFPTSTGGRWAPTNVRRRVLVPAVERANRALREVGGDPLPEGLTPHSLRRTFASLLLAIGEPPTHAMAQLGHTDPALTLRLYAREMARRDGERDRLRALVAGQDLPAVRRGSAAGAVDAHDHVPEVHVDLEGQRPPGLIDALLTPRPAKLATVEVEQRRGVEALATDREAHDLVGLGVALAPLRPVYGLAPEASPERHGG